MTATDHACPRTVKVDSSAPIRTKIAASLALLASIGCCALPSLIVAGILTGAGAAALRQTLIAVAIGLGVLALGMWWMRRRRSAKRATAAGGNGCADPSCVC